MKLQATEVLVKEHGLSIDRAWSVSSCRGRNGIGGPGSCMQCDRGVIEVLKRSSLANLVGASGSSTTDCGSATPPDRRACASRSAILHDHCMLLSFALIRSSSHNRVRSARKIDIAKIAAPKFV